MQILAKKEIVIKKSRFIAMYFEVDSEEEVSQLFSQLKKEYKKADHIVSAYRIGSKIKKDDDGEPSSTAGMPIMNLILQNDLSSCCIVVVRYFGGIKLGAGGLWRAYHKAASLVIPEKNC